MIIAQHNPQSSHSSLMPVNWRNRAAIASDLESLTDQRDWRTVFNAERELLTATARGSLGAYTLFIFQGEVSLVLARDTADLDLSKILRDDDVGFKIQEVGASLLAGAVEQRRVLEALPELTRRPITFTQNPDCWYASSGDGTSYLYYRDGSTSIQVTCFPGSEMSPSYTVKVQHSSDAPWSDLTEGARSSPAKHQAVQALIRKPIG